MAEFLIKPSKLGGNGLFTINNFGKGSVLMRLDGNKISGEDLLKLSSKDQSNSLQIGTDLFLDLRGKSHFFINHSCSPNAYIRVLTNTAFLMSSIPLKPGDELTIDYAIHNVSKTNLDECRCGHWGCRKIIGSWDTLPDNVKNRYIELKLVPNFILNR